MVSSFTPAVHEMKFSPLLVAAINRNSRGELRKSCMRTNCKLVKLEMSDAAAADG